MARARVVPKSFWESALARPPAAQGEPRRVPGKTAVRAYWADYLVKIGKFDSATEVFGGDYCFACGLDSGTVRCHILPRNQGGTDSCANVHMLCDTCHTDSEDITGDRYFDWLSDRTMIDSWVSTAMRSGHNIWPVIAKATREEQCEDS